MKNKKFTIRPNHFLLAGRRAILCNSNSTTRTNLVVSTRSSHGVQSHFLEQWACWDHKPNSRMSDHLLAWVCCQLISRSLSFVQHAHPIYDPVTSTDSLFADRTDTSRNSSKNDTRIHGLYLGWEKATQIYANRTVIVTTFVLWTWPTRYLRLQYKVLLPDPKTR